MLLKDSKHANFDYISLILIKHFFPLCKTNYQKRNNYESAVPKIVASQRQISDASEAALHPKKYSLQLQFFVTSIKILQYIGNCLCDLYKNLAIHWQLSL